METIGLMSLVVFIVAISVFALVFIGGIVAVVCLIRLISNSSERETEQNKVREINEEIARTEERIHSLEELLTDNRDKIPECIDHFPGEQEDKEQDMHNTKIQRSRSGVLAGVCSGIAKRYDFDPLWLRIAFVILSLSTIWPLILYFVLVFILPLEESPTVISDHNYGSRKNRTSPTLRKLEATRDRLEQRLRNLEDIVTSKNYDWDRRLNERES